VKNKQEMEDGFKQLNGEFVEMGWKTKRWTCTSPKFHPAEKLNRDRDALRRFPTIMRFGQESLSFQDVDDFCGAQPAASSLKVIEAIFRAEKMDEFGFSS
jgi:hypothetical protein